MDKNIKQRISLKLCAVNGISCAESLKMLQKAYGEMTLSKTRVYEWYSAFKSGRDVVEDLPRSGWPSMSSTEVNGVVYSEFLPEGQPVNKKYYLRVIKRLREQIRRKKADLWKTNLWILDHDNAPSHKAIIVNEFLAENSTNIIEQPPY